MIKADTKVLRDEKKFRIDKTLGKTASHEKYKIILGLGIKIDM